MTKEEKRRLDTIYQRLKDKKQIQKKRTKLDLLAPYLKTNEQVRKVLKHKSNRAKIQMRSKHLEKYFLKNREELEVG